MTICLHSRILFVFFYKKYPFYALINLTKIKKIGSYPKLNDKKIQLKEVFLTFLNIEDIS